MSRQGTYRPDIEGLRALAVMPVVVFHAGFPLIPGGFLGVDIFFVISGYLITGIIAREVANKSFSYIRFYERRVRRILPALLAMLTIVLIAGSLLLFPAEYNDLARSALAAVLSVANLYFYVTVNYFSGESFPLLHVWSLAVEEQFYLVLPPLLLLVWTYVRRWLVMILIVIALLSLVSAQIAIMDNPEAAFYQTQYRMWELMSGGILAIIAPRPPSGAVARNALGLTGLLMVLIPFAFVSRTVPFPGLSALPTCLGAVMLIGSAANDRVTLVSRALSLPPVRFIGLISYSLYLWHWPIIVLAREGAAFLPFSLSPDWRGRSAIVAVSLVAAVLSWRFVERPFRQPSEESPQNSLLLCVGAMALVFMAAGVISLYRGFPTRYPASAQALARYTKYDPSVAFRSGLCFIDSRYTSSQFNIEACLGSGTGRRILLIGDSHAAHLYPGLKREFLKERIGQITASGCRPLITTSVAAAGRCTAIMDRAFGEGISKFKPDTVIISGNWQSRDLAALPATLTMLRRHAERIILVGPVPSYDAALPKLLATAQVLKDPTLPERHILPNIRSIDYQLRRIAVTTNVTYFSPIIDMCGATAARCVKQLPNGAPIQFDSSHFTAEGSYWIAQRFSKIYPKGL